MQLFNLYLLYSIENIQIGGNVYRVVKFFVIQ